jgi:hypothetical protein
MTDTMTSQNIVLSSWDTLYIYIIYYLSHAKLCDISLCTRVQNSWCSPYRDSQILYFSLKSKVRPQSSSANLVLCSLLFSCTVQFFFHEYNSVITSSLLSEIVFHLLLDYFVFLFIYFSFILFFCFSAGWQPTHRIGMMDGCLQQRISYHGRHWSHLLA